MGLRVGQGWIDQDLNTLPWDTSCPSEERYVQTFKMEGRQVCQSVKAVACKLQNFETCSTRGCNRGCYQKNDDNQLLSNLFSSLRVAEACYIREQPGMSELLHRAPLETSFIIL